MAHLKPERRERYVAQARRQVVRAARARRLLTYSDVMVALGTDRGHVGEVLDEMTVREAAKGGPVLCAIVVRKGTRMPSPAFWLGPWLRQPVPEDAAGRKLRWEMERDSVWSFDWPGD